MDTLSHILIVEDSLDDQELCARLLHTTPGRRYRCSFASDATQALALIGTRRFDCVLIDYSLPGMDGLALLRSIRQTDEFLPLVMLTGQARDDLAAAILDAGANNYIDKAAIDQAHLHDAITAAIVASAHAQRAAARVLRPLLIIDDSADDREYYGRLLASGRYRSAPVVEASNGPAGLALLQECAFEAVLLDFSLPGMDGLDVLTRIRSARPFMPVVFMTGNGNVTVAVKALQLGACEYLVKSAIDAEGLDRAIAASVMKCALASKDAEIRAKTEALQASEERNRLLLRSLSEDAIIMLDEQGVVMSWNLTAERIKGYTAAEIVGRHYALFFTPEDLAAGVPDRELELARTVGRSTLEGWRLRKDGSRLYASVVLDAIRDDDGALRGFAKVTRDITELAAERAALRRANERITLATDSGGIGIWDYNVATHEMVWDSWMFRLYGMKPQGGAWSYHSWLERIVPQDRQDVARAWQDAIDGTRAYDLEFRVVWDDASVRTLRGCAQLTRDTVDHSVRLIGVNWDVTESRALAARLADQAGRLAQARDAAEKANEAKSRFLAGMSHELRTPLNGILGNARLLRLEGGLQPSQLARVESMLSAGGHLLEMVHCVLDLSAIETQRVVLRAEAVELRPMMHACLDVVRQMAAEKDLALHHSVAADVPLVALADPVRLRQILLNLLGNAVKFTRHGGIDLRLRTTADGAFLRFDVADTGPGIPPEKRHTLFQDFVRVQSADARTGEGAGLGLALSSQLAALMGGRLDHIDNPGGGAIFWLELPLLAPPPPAPPTYAPGALHAPTGAAARPGTEVRLNVLVVDDSETNLDIVASFVRLMGHQVTCAGSGAEAVQAVADTGFDVVLMDVQMPDMSGLEATRRIRALPGPRGQVPVIALTAQVFTEQLEECRQAGMSGHLGKPFTEAALYATLAETVPARAGGSGPTAGGTDPAEAPVPELLVIDLDVFAANTRLLQPASLVRYLENIVASARAVLSALSEQDHPGEINADVLKAAHKLAGNVGLLGFARAADAARRFERAVRTGTPETPPPAERLAAALQLTIHEVDARLAALSANTSGAH